MISVFASYIALASSAINDSQEGIGQMNIYYISKRISEGSVLYKDIAPIYGPVIYHIGSELLKLNFGIEELKIFMVGISIINGLLVFLISQKNFFNYKISCLATAVYMFSPIHYGMSPSFHVDSIAVFFILISFSLLLFRKTILYILSGLVAASALFVKIPVLPEIIAPIIFFTINKQNKKNFLYSLPLFSFFIIVYTYFKSIQETPDLTNLILEYTLKNPDEPFNMIRDLLWIEGFLIITSIIGLILIYKKYGSSSILIFYSLLSSISLGSIFLRGTNIYAIQYSEPFLAILTAYAIFHVKDVVKSEKRRIILPTLLVGILFSQFIIFDFPGRERILDWDGDNRTFEVNEIVGIHNKLLNEYTAPGDVVSAWPMSVAISNRILSLDNMPYIDLLPIQFQLGYKDQIKQIEKQLEGKKIKIIISYNSTERTNIKYDSLQNIFFFPYELENIKKIIEENYVYHEKDGLYFYTPKT